MESAILGTKVRVAIGHLKEKNLSEIPEIKTKYIIGRARIVDRARLWTHRDSLCRNKLTIPSVSNYFVWPSSWPLGCYATPHFLVFRGVVLRLFFPQLLRPPSSTITSLTGEQVRRSTHRTRTVLVSAFEKKSPLSSLPLSRPLARFRKE